MVISRTLFATIFFFLAGKCGMYFVEDNASDTIENSVSIRTYCPALIFPNYDDE